MVGDTKFGVLGKRGATERGPLEVNKPRHRTTTEFRSKRLIAEKERMSANPTTDQLDKHSTYSKPDYSSDAGNIAD